MDQERFDAFAKRLATKADRRTVVRGLAVAAAGGAIFAASRRETVAENNWVDRCARDCPGTCRQYSGTDLDQCLAGCKTCCWQGMFGADRSDRCMSSMLACIDAPNCPEPPGGNADTVVASPVTSVN